MFGSLLSSNIACGGTNIFKTMYGNAPDKLANTHLYPSRGQTAFYAVANRKKKYKKPVR